MLKHSLRLATVLLTCYFASLSFAATETNAAEKETVKKFTISAEEYVKKNGKDAAMKEFNDKNGKFVKGSMYIFAMDYQGVFLANAHNPEMVGKNQMELKDVNGKSITRELVDKAKSGGGWVTYRWNDPNENKVRCKTSYVVPMENSYLIGSGFYTNDKDCK